MHEQQAKDDFYLLSELIHDYIGIVSAVKDAFNERVKAWQSWQGVQVRLTIRYNAKAMPMSSSSQKRDPGPKKRCMVVVYNLHRS